MDPRVTLGTQANPSGHIQKIRPTPKNVMGRILGRIARTLDIARCRQQPAHASIYASPFDTLHSPPVCVWTRVVWVVSLWGVKGVVLEMRLARSQTSLVSCRACYLSIANNSTIGDNSLRGFRSSGLSENPSHDTSHTGSKFTGHRNQPLRIPCLSPTTFAVWLLHRE